MPQNVHSRGYSYHNFKHIEQQAIIIGHTLVSHLLTGTKFSDFTTFYIFSALIGLGAVQEVVTSVFIL